MARSSRKENSSVLSSASCSTGRTPFVIIKTTARKKFTHYTGLCTLRHGERPKISKKASERIIFFFFFLACSIAEHTSGRKAAVERPEGRTRQHSRMSDARRQDEEVGLTPLFPTPEKQALRMRAVSPEKMLVVSPEKETDELASLLPSDEDHDRSAEDKKPLSSLRSYIIRYSFLMVFVVFSLNTDDSSHLWWRGNAAKTNQTISSEVFSPSGVNLTWGLLPTRTAPLVRRRDTTFVFVHIAKCAGASWIRELNNLFTRNLFPRRETGFEYSVAWSQREHPSNYTLTSIRSPRRKLQQ